MAKKILLELKLCNDVTKTLRVSCRPAPQLMRRGELRAGDRVEAPERSGQRALYPGTVIQAHVSQGQTASVTLLFDDETLRRRAPVAEVKRERAGTACDVCNKQFNGQIQLTAHLL